MQSHTNTTKIATGTATAHPITASGAGTGCRALSAATSSAAPSAAVAAKIP
jgi:hypothetical protein